jgi:hypothetical protein
MNKVLMSLFLLGHKIHRMLGAPFSGVKLSQLAIKKSISPFVELKKSTELQLRGSCKVVVQLAISGMDK